jgi:hypothetical protein
VVAGHTGGPSGFLSAASSLVAGDAGTSWTANASRLTWLHPVGAGANRLLVVGVSIKGDKDTVTALSYGGVPLTFLGARGDQGSARVELWYLIAPASGWWPVSVNLSGSAEFVAGAETFYGVDQATPLGGFMANGSNGNGASDPSVVVTNAAGDLVIAVLAVGDGPGQLTPAATQAQKWIGWWGSGLAGAGAIAPGADTVTMGWTKTADANWAIGAVAVKPATWTGPPLDQFQVSFWAVRGQPRWAQINYGGAAGGAQPFLRLDVTDPVYVPGRGTLAPGDSVLLTVTVDPVSILVQLEPSGVQFGQPAGLHIWYGGAGGDLNGDGAVDSADADIESRLLKVWYQEGAVDPWTAIPAVRSSLDRTFTAELQHFSNYAVAY